MNLAGLLDDDWATFDDLVETVTYTPYDPVADAHGTPVANVTAIAQPETRQEHGGPDAATVFAASRRFHLRTATLGGTAVTNRGLVTRADGSVWAVESSTEQDFGGRIVVETVGVPGG